MTKILVIEDTDEIRLNILDLLEAVDFEAVGAENGRVGVQVAKSQGFDLIICDVMMPELDGYGVLEELRNNPDTASVPFIFLTAKGDKSDLRMGMNLGADDYLTKPCTNEELLDAIEARLRRVEKLKEEVAKQIQPIDNKIDALTGLPNRAALEGESGYFNLAIQTTDKTNRFVPFLLLGLDRFARINDALGYVNADSVLQQVAQRLLTFFKPISGASVSRVGGDEFAIILPPISEQESAMKSARELLQILAQPFDVAGKFIPITGTIGIAFYPLAASLEEIRRQADVAMGEGKREGGNCAHIYQRPMFGLEASQDLQLAADFVRAWEKKTLQVYYQPRLDIRKNKITGVAAVVQWEHPLRGLIPPEKIMMLAEEAGLSRNLAEWLLQIACQQGKKWQQLGISLRVSVWLPEKLFIVPNLVEVVVNIMQGEKGDSRCLELEVSASTIANYKNLNELAAKFLSFQRLGIETTISQFGLEHSSLSYLKQLALNYLKIEGSLVANTVQNAPIFNALIQMAHNLKLKVVAAGVETEEQGNFLKKQKCDYLQQKAAFSGQEINRVFGKR